MSNTELILYMRGKIEDVLGDQFDNYISFLRKVFVFNSKISNEELMEKNKAFFKAEDAELATRFLLSFLMEIDATASPIIGHSSSDDLTVHEASGDAKVKRVKLSNDEENTIPKPKVAKIPPTRIPRKNIPLDRYLPVLIQENDDILKTMQHMPIEPEFQDISIVHGHALIIAMQAGIQKIDSKCVKLLLASLYNQLRSILMSVLSRRNAYKMRDNKFQYSVGCPSVNIYLKNSVHAQSYPNNSAGVSVISIDDRPYIAPNIMPTMEWSVANAALQSACDTRVTKYLPPVSAWDLFDALQVNRSTIPTHSVYSRFMESIISKLYHPSEYELQMKSMQKLEHATYKVLNAEEVACNKYKKLHEDQIRLRSEFKKGY